jgi:DNA mismatch endonuclease (patch repair protein)
MSRVRNTDTAPELLVRRIAHGLGLRFRLRRRDLPGNPDLVLPKYRLAVFVHGCFWHQHPGCRKATIPKTRRDFWSAKLRKNVDRDLQVPIALERAGWRSCIIWECETGNTQLVKERLLGATKATIGDADLK